MNSTGFNIGDKYIHIDSNKIWTVEDILFEEILLGRNNQLTDWADYRAVNKLSNKEVLEMELGLKVRKFKETAKLPVLDVKIVSENKKSENDKYFEVISNTISSYKVCQNYLDWEDGMYGEYV